MNKRQIILMVEKRIPKELLLGELIKVKKTLGHKIDYYFNIGCYIGFFSLFSIVTLLSFFIGNELIKSIRDVVLFLFPCGVLFFLVSCIVEYFSEQSNEPKKYYKDKKFRKELQKHHEVNEKLNAKLDYPLSLSTYQLMTKYFSESELKEIARLKLTYRDLNLEDYYFTSGKEVVLTRSHIERIELANKLRDAKLVLIEKIKEEEKKEKKIEASDIFVSSLYKK